MFFAGTAAENGAPRNPTGAKGLPKASRGHSKIIKISLWGRLVPICDFRGSGGAAGTPNRGVLDGFFGSSVRSLGVAYEDLVSAGNPQERPKLKIFLGRQCGH